MFSTSGPSFLVLLDDGLRLGPLSPSRKYSALVSCSYEEECHSRDSEAGPKICAGKRLVFHTTNGSIESLPLPALWCPVPFVNYGPPLRCMCIRIRRCVAYGARTHTGHTSSSTSVSAALFTKFLTPSTRASWTVFYHNRGLPTTSGRVASHSQTVYGITMRRISATFKGTLPENLMQGRL